MKILFMGCVKFSQSLLDHLVESGEEICGVITKSYSNFNSDFCSLSNTAKKNKFPLLELEKNSDTEVFNFAEDLSPDVIFCFGWNHLLEEKLITLPKITTIGYHPTSLPMNRGRHPIIWTLVLGLNKTASTFFHIAKGADDGDILSQVHIEVGDTDDAASLYEKLTHSAKVQVSEFCEQLKSNNYPRIKQNSCISNHWRKRSQPDGMIDWRMNSKSIYNLVRGLTRPYVGAQCMYNEKKVNIWKVVPLTWNKVNIEPGKVLRVDGQEITIKCSEGAIKVIDHEFKELPTEGSYL